MPPTSRHRAPRPRRPVLLLPHTPIARRACRVRAVAPDLPRCMVPAPVGFRCRSARACKPRAERSRVVTRGSAPFALGHGRRGAEGHSRTKVWWASTWPSSCSRWCDRGLAFAGVSARSLTVDARSPALVASARVLALAHVDVPGTRTSSTSCSTWWPCVWSGRFSTRHGLDAIRVLSSSQGSPGRCSSSSPARAGARWVPGRHLRRLRRHFSGPT